MKKRTLYITKAALIAALYAVLTFFGAMLNLSYGSIQFRFAEALCILPLFTGAAVPGLTVGCFVANINSTVNPMDIILGTGATFVSALAARKLGNIKIKGYPFLSLLMPVIFNGVIVGAEIAFFTSRESFWAAFGWNVLTVSAGEAAVMFTLGTMLYFAVKKNTRLNTAITDK